MSVSTGAPPVTDGRSDDRPASGGGLRHPTRDGIRPEIQALRAAAVVLVLLFHLAPTRLPGGYVGVDVFFVISGYLITAHIAKPLRRGTFTVSGFYARRAVRLLPASLLVLGATLAATLAFVPRNLWPQFGEQIAASALYVENWVLAGNATNYSAPAANVSPVQHFWSLSAEEQFYLAWPALLVAAQWIAIRTGRWRRSFLLVLGPLALASFVFSVVATSTEPAAAYFVTPTRAWEFAAGGLLWLVVHRLDVLPDAARAAAGWVGIAAIAVAALAFDAATPFPGWIALVPVVATVLVIAAGLPDARWSASRFLRLPVVQATGDMSYALYLWHWPLVVLVPYAIGVEGARGRAIGVALAIPLAYLTRRFVEVPVLAAYGSHGAPRWRAPVVGAAVLAGMALVAVPAVAMDVRVRAQQEAARDALAAVTADPPPCFGAAALQGGGCDPTAAGTVHPDPLIGDQDDFGILHHGCQVRGAITEPRTCTFGDPDGTVDVALVGDSHAAQWQPALDAVAAERGWRLTTYLRSGCPVTVDPPEGRGTANAACAQWERNVLDELAGADYTYVFTSALSATRYTGGDGVDGFVDAWSRIGESGARVVALRDNPDPTAAGIDSTPACVADRGADACATAIGTSLRPDPLVEAVERTPGAALVDLTPYFCLDDACPAVLGGVLVYHQSQHVTVTYMRSLAPALGHAVDEALAAG